MLRRRAFLAAASAGLGLPNFVRLAKAASADTPQTLRAVYHPGIPPYSYVETPDGPLRGILVDLLDIVGQASGYRFSHQGFPWARAQHMVEAGEADVLCCPPTSERSGYTLFAPAPVITLAEGEHFFAADNPHAAQIRAARKKDDLYPFSMVSFLGNSNNDATWANHPRRYVVGDIEQIFQMLLAGRADFYTADPTVTRFKLKQLGLLEKFGSVPAGYIDNGHPVEMHFGLRRSYPEAESVVARIDGTIRQAITPQLRNMIVARYTS